MCGPKAGEDLIGPIPNYGRLGCGPDISAHLNAACGDWWVRRRRRIRDRPLHDDRGRDPAGDGILRAHLAAHLKDDPISSASICRRRTAARRPERLRPDPRCVKGARHRPGRCPSAGRYRCHRICFPSARSRRSATSRDARRFSSTSRCRGRRCSGCHALGDNALVSVDRSAKPGLTVFQNLTDLLQRPLIPDGYYAHAAVVVRN